MKIKHALFFALILVILIFAPSPKTTQAISGCDGANIIFSELDYDQPSTDTADFLELYIPVATTIENCEIRFINGLNNTDYRINTIDGIYSAKTYLLLSSGSIQNGDSAPDGFALIDTSGSGSVVWFYSYEGQITGYDPGDGTSNSSTDIGVIDNNNSPNISLVNGSAAGVGDTITSSNPTPGQPNQNDSGSPTAVSLQSLTTQTNTILPLLLTILLLLGSSTLFIWRRNHR